MKIRIPLLCLFLLLWAGYYLWTHENESPKPKVNFDVPSQFVLESGPEGLGWSRAATIRHKETGQRFLFVERSGGSVFMVPLNPTP